VTPIRPNVTPFTGDGRKRITKYDQTHQAVDHGAVEADDTQQPAPAAITRMPGETNAQLDERVRSATRQASNPPENQ
jgi:hypothetical protein